MRPLVLAIILASLSLSPALAVAAANPQASPPENAPLPVRQGLSMAMPQLQEDTALQAAIASTGRVEADRARDSQRHPFESLTFWGLTPGMTVIELEPGSAGWWRTILEPYAQVTGGTYVPVNKPLEGMGVADGTADMVLVARALHNWHRAGVVDANLQAIFKALKPGGILAIEQHRSHEGLNVAETVPTGYVPESYVIHAARAAGFELEARSELNANPKDDRDHPFGVWTLAPSRKSEGKGRVLTPEERTQFDAIGESDRMTLRFRKPMVAD